MSEPWAIVPLGEVLTERQEEPSAEGLANGEIRIVAKVGFGNGQIQLRSEANTKTGMVLIRPGDLVVSGINAAKGAIAVYGEENTGPIAATIHYGAYIPDKNKVDVRYLWWLLRSRTFRDLLLKHVPGGIKTELKANRLLPIPIPCPPLSEQQRIVTRIEELAAKIDEAQSLRQQAVEEGDAILPAILGQFFKALAKNFKVKTLNDLSLCITDGPHKTPYYVQRGIPFVTVKNMVTGKLNLANVQYITLSDHEEFSKRCKPEQGDVLYSKDGATRGQPCFVDLDREFNIFVSVALIKPLREQLNSRYLCHLLNSTWIKDRMVNKSRGDMIPHIVLREIRQFPVPVPPLDEQIRIVDYLDNLQGKVDRLKSFQAQTGTELDAILPSILDKAFRGDL